MANNRIFADSATLLKINFPGATTNSDNVAGVGLPNRGNSQIRRLGFSSSWSLSDVSFLVFEDDSFENGKVLFVSDGVDNIPLVLINCGPDTTVSLQAPWLDSVNFFQIVSSVPQAAQEIDGIFEPLFQVIG